MEPFNYTYKNNNQPKLDIQPLIDLYYSNVGKVQTFSKDIPELSANTLFRDRSSKFKSLNDLRSALDQIGYLQYFETAFNEAEADGIEGCYDFFTILQGQHDAVPKRTGMAIHTHGQRDESNKDHTYTKIYPLAVSQNISETIWAKWVDYENVVVPPINYDSPITTPEFDAYATKWFKHLEAKSIGDELLITFPDSSKSLTLNFNGGNWLHGVKSISSNLYLVVIFNDYIK